MARQTVKFRSSKHNMDYVLLAVVLFLVAFGLLMIYSVSSYEAGVEKGDSAFYLKNQAQSTMVGFVAMFIMIKFPAGRGCKDWRHCLSCKYYSKT